MASDNHITDADPAFHQRVMADHTAPAHTNERGAGTFFGDSDAIGESAARDCAELEGHSVAENPALMGQGAAQNAEPRPLPAGSTVEHDAPPPPAADTPPAATTDKAPHKGACNLEKFTIAIKRGDHDIGPIDITPANDGILIRALAPSSSDAKAIKATLTTSTKNDTTDDCHRGNGTDFDDHPSVSARARADFYNSAGTPATLQRANTTKVTDVSGGERKDVSFRITGNDIQKNPSFLKQSRMGYLGRHWSEHLTPNTWNLQANSCGQPAGDGQSVRHLKAKVEIYPEDRYYLDLTIPPLFKVAMAESEEQGPSIIDESTTTSYEEAGKKVEYTVNAGMYEGKMTVEAGESSSSGKYAWKPTLKLERNGEDLDEGSFSWAFRLAEGVGAITATIEDAVKFIQNCLPKVGWWYEADLTMCEGHIRGMWGWKEIGETPEALNDVGFGQHWDIDLKLIAGTIAWKAGLEFQPLKFVNSNIGVIAMVRAAFTSEASIKEQMSDPRRLLADESPDTYTRSAVLAPATVKQSQQAGFGADCTFQLTLESRIMVGHPFLADIRFWTKSALTAGLAIAANREYLDEIQLEAEKPLSEADAKLIETPKDAPVAKSTENEGETQVTVDEGQTRPVTLERPMDPGAPMDPWLKMGFRFKGLAVYGYIKLVGKTVLGHSGSRQTQKQVKAISKERNKLLEQNENLKNAYIEAKHVGDLRAANEYQLQMERNSAISKSLAEDAKLAQANDTSIEPLGQPLKAREPIMRSMPLCGTWGSTSTTGDEHEASESENGIESSLETRHSSPV